MHQPLGASLFLYGLELSIKTPISIHPQTYRPKPFTWRIIPGLGYVVIGSPPFIRRPPAVANAGEAFGKGRSLEFGLLVKCKRISMRALMSCKLVSMRVWSPLSYVGFLCVFCVQCGLFKNLCRTMWAEILRVWLAGAS